MLSIASPVIAGTTRDILPGRTIAAHTVSHKSQGGVQSYSGEWISDPAQSSLLDHMASLAGGMWINPPIGYTLHPKSMTFPKFIAQGYEWDGPVRPDGTSASLMVGVVLPLTGMFIIDGNTTAKRLLVSMLSPWASDPAFVHSALEHGSINGVPFVREYFKDTPDATSQAHSMPGTGSNAPQHGLIYTGFTKSCGVFIGAYDSEPYNKTTLKTLEASAMTVRKM